MSQVLRMEKLRMAPRSVIATERDNLRAAGRSGNYGLPIALTMGDACGIGPEIVAQLWWTTHANACFVVGDVNVMRRAVALTGGGLAVARITSAADALSMPPACVPVMQVDAIAADLIDAPIGQVDARAGAAAAACVEVSVRLALSGEIAAIVTAPLHKEALAAAGVPYPGHTEMLQALACPGGVAPPVRMMLANDQLRVVLVTIHLSLRKAIDAVTFDAVLETIRMAHRSAPHWGQTRARIAVAGLNPHAGEGGLFGDEELRIIAPAVAAARREGIDAQGPFAPDTVFMRARHGPARTGQPEGAPAHVAEFDIVVAMTHDHGLIPVKYLGFDDGVNVTLGLPFVRMSPDHGTAFDIAGTGTASPSSLLAALRMARDWVSA
jgi:4-hydroxythreonine-4-phosphate dehydrogenase